MAGAKNFPKDDPHSDSNATNKWKSADWLVQLLQED